MARTSVKCGSMWRRIFLILAVTAWLLPAQKYSGPTPPKPDIPYLLHADSLLETEAGEAKEEGKKDDITYVIAGASSPAKTPLASPIFLLDSKNLSPERLEIYRLEVRNGRREVLFSRKKRKTSNPVRTTVNRVGDNLYRIEVDQSLEKGEYSITPNGSNQVFCFAVY